MQKNLKNEDLKKEKFESCVEQMLSLVGEDPRREGLAKTPERVFKAFEFLTSGYWQDPKVVLNDALFDSSNNEMVLVRDIEFYSLCEHHLLPFFGEVHLAYLPHGGKVAGFGKFSRLVDTLARRPQLQERLTQQIAAAIEEDLSAEGVMAIVSAQQLCMMIRGELSLGTRTLTAESRGRIQSDVSLQQQAWQLLMEAK